MKVYLLKIFLKTHNKRKINNRKMNIKKSEIVHAIPLISYFLFSFFGILNIHGVDPQALKY